MKILFVIDSLGSGGAQRQFINIVNGISKIHNCEIFLYNPNSEFYREDLSSSIPIHQTDRINRKGFNFNVLRRLIRCMKSFDIVISFQPTANIYCSLANLFTRKVKHISCEMSVINETESSVRRLITNIANFLSNHVICNSFKQAEYIASLSTMKDKVSTVWNGCEEINYTPPPVKNCDQFSMVIVARVAYPKNGLRLLEALKIFYEQNGFLPNISWAGRDDNDARSKLLKAQMINFLEKNPCVSNKFNWLGEVSDINTLYAKSDALLSVSTYEGVPVVICEAMLSGCPVIASRISDNSRILGDGKRGFLCDPLSPDDICHAIENRLAAAPSDIQEMSARARLFAEEHFSIDNMVEGYLGVISNLQAEA